MTTKALFFAGCAVVLLAVAGCGRKDAPAVAPAMPAPAAAAGQGRNTAAPVDGPATLAAPAAAGAGAVIDVRWTGPGNTGDYIDLVPRGDTATSGEITYAYTRDAMPAAKLTLPTTPGDYDIRYVLDTGSARTIKATAPIAVTAVAATLTGPPAVEGAEPIEVAWSGPSGDQDYIDIVPSSVTEPSGEITYAWARDGSPAKLTAPGKAGDHLVRYVQEGPTGRKILSISPLRVTQPAATIDGPDIAAAGAAFNVEWSGPKRRGDYVDLVKKGQVETSGELSYFYTAGSSNSQLKAPAEAGQYDIRYVLEAPGGRVVLARRTISVR
ncbi:MAG: hypothetical protein AB7G76_00395 [Steroidobacteraceae bacterium]